VAGEVKGRWEEWALAGLLVTDRCLLGLSTPRVRGGVCTVACAVACCAVGRARDCRRLVHAGGPCLAPGIRYATYYRMHVEEGEGGALGCSHLA
jgi:hypothetical protein